MMRQNKNDSEREYRLHLENTVIHLLIGQTEANEVQEAENYFLHDHVSAEIFACGEGETELRNAGETIVLKKGDIAIVPPGILHKKREGKKEEVSYVVAFSCHREKIGGDTDLYKMLSPYVTGDRVLIYRRQPQLVEAVRQIVTQHEEVSPLLPPIWLVQLLFTLRDKESVIAGTGKKGAEKLHKFSDLAFITRLDNLIAANYDKDCDTAEIAEQLYISARQLDRIIRKRYGKTLHCIFMEKRVRAAEYYLKATNMTVDSIAITVGFNSSAGLYREFAKMHGMTPAQYRKKE